MANTTLHSAVGIKIGVLLPGLLGIVISFLSHFPCDFFPEAYSNIKPWYIIAESLLFVATVAFVFLFGINPWHLFWCALAANIPDIFDSIFYKKYHKNFFFCHPQPRVTTLGFEFQTTEISQWLNFTIDFLIVILVLGAI